MVGAGAREGSGDVTSLKFPWRIPTDPLRPLLADHSEPIPFLFPHCSTPSQASGLASETPNCSQTVSEASGWLSVSCPAWTVPVLSPPHAQLATCSWGPNQQLRCTQVPASGIEKGGGGFSRGHGSSWGTSASPSPQLSPFGLTEDRTQFSESKDTGSNLTPYQASHGIFLCLSLVTCEMGMPIFPTSTD